MIAEVSAPRTKGSLVAWIAQYSDHADFAQFFHLSLISCALLLAGPFIMWMRIGQTPKSRHQKPWSLKLPEHSIAHDTGQVLRSNNRGWLHLGTGVLLTSSLILMMMWLLLHTGWFRLEQPVMWLEAAKKSLLPAVFIAIFLEVIFRGILLGICLRPMRPITAMLAVSFLFALVHFLYPINGINVSEPEKWDAGFRMWGLIGQRFAHPVSFLLPFLSVFFIGLILAYARFRTASLWLPVGLHLGWIFVYRIFKPITEINGEHLDSASFFISADRDSGLLPLSLLLATALLVHVFAQISEEKRNTREEKAAKIIA